MSTYICLVYLIITQYFYWATYLCVIKKNIFIILVFKILLCVWINGLSSPVTQTLLLHCFRNQSRKYSIVTGTVNFFSLYNYRLERENSKSKEYFTERTFKHDSNGVSEGVIMSCFVSFCVQFLLIKNV